MHLLAKRGAQLQQSLLDNQGIDTVCCNVNFFSFTVQILLFTTSVVVLLLLFNTSTLFTS